MKSLQWGLMMALLGVMVALGGLWGFVWLGTGPWQVARAAPPAQDAPLIELTPANASVVQAVGIAVTATVGTTSGACANTNIVHVRANTTVYYCFKVHHLGVSGDEPLTLHNVQASRGEVNRDLESFSLNPGEIRNITSINSGPFLTDSTSVDVTNFITWTARPQDNEPVVVATNRAYVDIVTPAVNVTKSVGQDPLSCPTASNVRVPSGQSVSFCISVQNTGDITFTRYILNDQPLGIVNASFNYTLPPGSTLQIIPNNLRTLGITNGSLERANVTSRFVNNASLTAYGGTGLEVSGVSTATVDIGTTTVRFTKTVSTEEESCNGTNTIQTAPGTMVYYCVKIENTGSFTLTHHYLNEQYLSIDVDFEYVLRPGETLKVTNGFLRERNQPIVFGPFELHPRFGNVINNSMNYNGTSPDGFSVTASAGTTGGYPATPTVTRTSRPDPTRTSTPAPTSTPTPTFTPTPITPSPTPTETPITPSPTPTISYAITSLETPTPRSQPEGIDRAPVQETSSSPDQQTGQQPTGTPQPGQDPVLATATQIAVDATATTVAAEATAAQIEIEDAQATAFAVVQPPQPESPLAQSPLPTPTIDPALEQAGVPGEETPTETPTELAPEFPPETPTEIPTATSTGTPPAPTLAAPPQETPVPGSEVTVLPPQETVVIATATVSNTSTVTPAVVVLVVTNTPEVGAAEAAGQRPIEYPTPTTTPDFVMAAARTFDVAVATFGWLWFLVGSLIFFVTAGIMAGLFFRQSEARRYDLAEPDYWLEDELASERGAFGADAEARDAVNDDDDEWPENLP